MIQIGLDDILVPGDEFEIDTADFLYAVGYFFMGGHPRPRGKKLCKIIRIYANSEKICYVCSAVKPTQYTPAKEFVIEQPLDNIKF